MKKSVKIWGLVIAASLIAAVSDGIKNNYGIMLGSIIENSGLTYSAVSLALATGQLFFGLVQPFFGIFAEKKGHRLAMLMGIVLILLGLMLLPHCHSALALLAVLGLLLPAGTGATSYSIVVGALAPKLPSRTASLATGIVNASSGVGNAVLSPIVQALLLKGGISAAMLVLSFPTLLLIPLCLFLSRREPGEERKKGEAGSFKGLGECLRSRNYILLLLGFFTCGFHMSLISNHLPSQVISYGIAPETSALAFSAYGLVTMAGSVLSGALTGRFSKKNVLGLYYLSRPLITLLFLLLPKSVPSVFAFAVLLGLTGAATVPPVTGIILENFGPERVGTLYGLVFFVHQIGAFLSASLCGVAVDMFSSYVPAWAADIVLSTAAALLSFSIKPRSVSVR